MTYQMNQLRLPLGTFTETRPHPSWGGNIYEDPWRDSTVTMFRLGIPLDTPNIRLL